MSKCCCSSGRPAAAAGPNRSSSRGGSIVYCAVCPEPDDLAEVGRRSRGLPYEARAITLYSSDECRKPR